MGAGAVTLRPFLLPLCPLMHASGGISRLGARQSPSAEGSMAVRKPFAGRSGNSTSKRLRVAKTAIVSLPCQ